MRIVVMHVAGLRIELGEIENALKSAGGSVKDAVVVAAGNILVSFTSGSASPKELQDACRAKLPEYMVPKVYLTVDGEDGWPRTSSMKVDRKVLVERAQAQIDTGPTKEMTSNDAAEAAEAGVDSLGMVRMAERDLSRCMCR